MRPLALVPVVGLTFALFLIPGRGQPPAGIPTTKLPLTRIVLSNAGVGYFHRSGSVEGPASVELKIDREDVNDLLKTLLAEDSNGAPPRSVTFDHSAPADVTLRAFALDLAVNPTVGHLLHQARGEKVAIAAKDGSNVTGLIVSVEKPMAEVITPPSPGGAGSVVKSVVVPPPADAVERVNLLTDDGLQSVPLSSIKKVKFLKAELEAEFRKALEALAAGRSEGKKSVSVQFAGAGKRDVKVGYVAEAPLWKPSYRLSLAGAAAKIQAWATVENATDEDWTNVSVVLSSGRPMTFQMDLYEPLYLPRPLVEPEAFASLRPPLYSLGQFGQLGGALGQQGGIGGFGGGGMPGNLPPRGANQGAGGGQGGFGGQSGFGGQWGGQFGFQGGTFYVRPGVRSLTGERLTYDEFVQRMQNKVAEKKVTYAGIGGGLYSAASELSLGEPAEYKIAEPVSLPRFKTALLPIHAGAVDVERVSIYNAATLASYPLLGLRLTNGTGLFLPGGPVAVYDDGSFAGEARLPDLRKGQSRLVSYAIDLLTTVRPSEVDVTAVGDDTVIESGTLRWTLERRYARKYAVRTTAAGPRTVLIEHPADPRRTLVAPVKPDERAKDSYRFAVTVKPGETATLEVVERASVENASALDVFVDSGLDEMRAKAKRPAVKAFLDRLVALRADLAATKKAIAAEQAALKQIEDDQTRLRANIERVPRDSDAYKRYLKKFDEQETEIESRRKTSATLTSAVETKSVELAAFVKNATAK